MSENRCIGILGGTFNPVHNGHLKTALGLVDKLHLDQLLLTPCALPPHKELPENTAQGVTNSHRIGMLRAAINGQPKLRLDLSEIDRARENPERASYTVDTLQHCRQEFGTNTSLVKCIGMDSFLSLPSWHRWRELLDYAHLAIVERPGYQLDTLPAEVGQLLRERGTNDFHDLRSVPQGRIMLVQLPPQDVSSTGIRDLLRRQQDISALVPGPVLKYIKQHDLYRS